MGKHSLDLGENTPRWIPSIKNPDKPADYLNYDHFIRAYPHLEKFLTRHQGDRFEDIDWWMYVNAPNAKMGTKNYNIGRVPKSDAALAEHQRLYAEKLRQKQTSSAAAAMAVDAPVAVVEDEEPEQQQEEEPKVWTTGRLISVQELFDLIAKFREFLLEKEKETPD